MKLDKFLSGSSANYIVLSDRDMKLICVRNLGFEEELTCGRTYDIIGCTPNKIAVYIINDEYEHSIYPRRYFVNKEEWRDIKLNELGIIN